MRNLTLKQTLAKCIKVQNATKHLIEHLFSTCEQYYEIQ